MVYYVQNYIEWILENIKSKDRKLSKNGRNCYSKHNHEIGKTKKNALVPHVGKRAKVRKVYIELLISI